MVKYYPEETKKVKSLSRRKREKISQQFRSLMIRQGIDSYTAIKERVKISGAGLSGIFHGNFVPNPKMAAQLSRELGITPSKFYAILGIRNSPRVQEAQEYYASLDERQAPPIPYNFRTEEMDCLYRRLVKSLDVLYEKGNIINKAKIVGGLEVLISLYSR